jgi:hypothetical protein
LHACRVRDGERRAIAICAFAYCNVRSRVIDDLL